MAKNILIFADGTGQAGGLKPDQRLSNIYKMFRASRVGPDNPVDPSVQIAFYDAGLGTESDEGTAPIKVYRFARKFVSAAIGFGISRNIADCYEAILKHYEPGDRIFLFGFSRGAYTVRCVAGVLNLCGVPTCGVGATACPRYGRALRAIANEAVQAVYEHGAGRDRAKFEPEREEKARRFREKYGADHEGKANVAPYFIGVFDTVAALGATGFKKLVMNAALFGLGFGAAAFFAKMVELFLDLDFLTAFLTLLVIGLTATVLPLARMSLKVIRDYPRPGEFRWHFAGWRSGFYDKYLDERVRYGRHALAIDETRKDFSRVPWGVKGAVVKRGADEPEWLRQIWFAGNHSDIGGSYPEDESRLSDIALQWMLEQALELPHPMIVDSGKLHLFPSPAGMQHSEVEAVFDTYPAWLPRRFRVSWPEQPRTEALGAPLHATVFERFGLSSVPYCGERKPYRPGTLISDQRVARFYSTG
jgi:uncharacterized protein (DUF2235 family)